MTTTILVKNYNYNDNGSDNDNDKDDDENDKQLWTRGWNPSWSVSLVLSDKDCASHHETLWYLLLLCDTQSDTQSDT